MSYLKNYFAKVLEGERTFSAISFMAALDAMPFEVARNIEKELKDQRSHLKLIASENFSSLAVQQAMGNLFTDKYSEGSVRHRFYAGCDNVDAIEEMAIEYAKKIFSAEHAYVQPHSGADANLVAFFAILIHRIQNKEIEKLKKKNQDELTKEEYETIRRLLVNQKVMGLSLHSGGHLTHGYRHNVSAKIFQAVTYDVDPKTHLIDYVALQKRVKEEKPFILLAGYSAYQRLIDFSKMREIADSVGATLMVDMAHFSGLVAGKVFQGNYNPIPFAEVITTTTHKTLRGPRGGMVLCTKEFQEVVDKGCPMVLGGPLPHVMAAKAVAFREANDSAFAVYAAQIVKNAKALAENLMKLKVPVQTGGTDNHIVVFDVLKSFQLNGRQAEAALREAKITCNRNSLPFDPNGPWYTSGIRMGTPALTTLGMKEGEMKIIAEVIADLLKHTQPDKKASVHIDQRVLKRARRRLEELLQDFPLYPELVL